MFVVMLLCTQILLEKSSCVKHWMSRFYFIAFLALFAFHLFNFMMPLHSMKFGDALVENSAGYELNAED